MRTRVALSFLLFAGLCAAPAFAQRVGTRIGRNLNEKNGASALAIVVECYANARTKQARMWMEALPGSPAEKTLLDRENPQFSLCMASNAMVMDNKRIRMSSRTVRRPLGIEMARLMLVNGRPVPPLTAEPVFTFASRLAGAKSDEFNADDVSYLEFGHCVAVHAWTASLDLLRSSVGSAEEHAAQNKMIPALGPCLTEGMKVTIQRENLREIVGEPVYHLLTGPAAGAGGDA